jgi:transposase
MEPHQYVGIDVSAKSLAVEVSLGEEPPQRLEFANTTAGHKALIKRLLKRGRTAYVCLEATGVYGLDLALALHRAHGVEVMVVNPRSAKRFAEALGTRSKTDGIDAGVLREFARRMPFEAWQPPALERLELRAITRRINTLVRSRTREKNRLHAAGATGQTTAIVRQDLESHIEHLDHRIQNLRAQALAMVAQHRQLQRMMRRICAIPGFGTVSALQVTGELAALPSDMSVRQWVAHAGLDPRLCESGSSVHRPARISRAGNRHLRAPLYMPALVAIQRQEHVRAFYQRLLARNKKPLQAIVAVMRKLLHAIFGMLRNDDPFEGGRLFSPRKA